MLKKLIHPDLPQKTRILAFIALGGSVLSLLGVLTAPILNIPTNQLYSYMFTSLLCIAAFVLAIKRIHTPAVFLVFGGFFFQFLFVIGNGSNEYTQLFILPFFLLGLIAVSLIYNARTVLWATFVSCIGWPIATTLVTGKFDSALTIISGVAILFIGSLVWYTVRELEKSLVQSEQRAKDLQTSQSTLQAQTFELEKRTSEAEQKRREATSTLMELQRTTNERDDLARSLQEATLPIMPVHEQVMVMPLVGAIDSNRAHLLNESLLRGIERNHARIVILDITGVPLIDTQVAGALLRSAEAARLLGAQTILVGVRPEVAQTIVGLGLDLKTLHVTSDLQSGIAQGMDMLRKMKLN